MTVHTHSPEQTSRLVERPGDALLGCIDGVDLTVDAFMQRTRQIAGGLPAGSHIINLCTDRIDFICSLAAVAFAGKTNLLPPNRQSGTIRDMLEDYPGAWVLHDAPLHGIDVLAKVSIEQTLNSAPADDSSELRIDNDHLAAIAFTSGSTGKASPNPKYWHALYAGAVLNARNMVGELAQTHHMLATVPPQHMYGLELSVTLPLVADVCVHGGQPLYPEDVRQALEAMPSPRILVSTPTHLRAIIKSGLKFPDAAFIFSATSPLDQQLARDVEQAFGGSLVEIYGCSEAGSIARRLSAHDEDWTPFDDCQFMTSSDGATVSLPYFPDPIPLQDILDIKANGRFALAGRLSDMINIAGKRGSFSALNQFLVDIPGVIDGVIFDPSDDDSGADVRRLAAMVVAPGLQAKDIQLALRERVDAVFVPRPIMLVDALPRTESSKLPRKALLQLFKALRKSP